jgi:hypothetical protein
MKMNLTKGKISKLHNKKKQSVKKYKKRAKTHKTKTLRRKHKSVNLVKSTLKNYKVWFGGDGEGGDATDAVSPIVPTNAPASPIDNAPAAPASPIDNVDASPIDNAIPNTSTDNIDTDVSVDIPEESPMDIGAGDVPDAEDIPSAAATSEESPMDINTEVGPSADDNTSELISQENTTALEESNHIIDEPLEIEATAPATTPSPVTEIEAPTPVQVEEIEAPAQIQPQEQISADDLALLRAIKAIVNKAVQQPQPLVDENAASNIAGTALTFANSFG